MRFCPTCKYYLYLVTNEKAALPEGEEEGGGESLPKLLRVCRACGYQEEDTKGGLVLELDLQEKTSEGYKILMNEFTKKDPTLPHVDTIKCPNSTCLSNSGSTKRDVIYLKYDATHMKFVYICNVCDATWKSKA